MRRQRANTKFATTSVAVLGMGMMACLGGGWSMSPHQAPIADPILAAAEVVALRFPDELLDAAAPAEPSAVDAATASDAADTVALFNPLPTYPQMAMSAERPQPPSTTGSVLPNLQVPLRAAAAIPGPEPCSATDRSRASDSV